MGERAGKRAGELVIPNALSLDLRRSWSGWNALPGQCRRQSRRWPAVRQSQKVVLDLVLLQTEDSVNLRVREQSQADLPEQIINAQ